MKKLKQIALVLMCMTIGLQLFCHEHAVKIEKTVTERKTKPMFTMTLIH